MPGRLGAFAHRSIPLVPERPKLRDPHFAADRVQRLFRLARQRFVASSIHHDEERRSVELRVGVELHVVVEALERIAPVGDDPLDLAGFDGVHDLVHLQHCRDGADVLERGRYGAVRRAQPQALEIRQVDDAFRSGMNEARVVHEKREDLVVAVLVRERAVPVELPQHARTLRRARHHGLRLARLFGRLSERRRSVVDRHRGAPAAFRLELFGERLGHVVLEEARRSEEMAKLELERLRVGANCQQRGCDDKKNRMHRGPPGRKLA